MKKILSVFLALMVSAFLLAGCETSPSSISASTSAEQPIAVELSDYSDIKKPLPSPKYSCNRFQAILAQPNNSALQDWKV